MLNIVFLKELDLMGAPKKILGAFGTQLREGTGSSPASLFVKKALVLSANRRSWYTFMTHINIFDTNQICTLLVTVVKTKTCIQTETNT